MMCDLVILACDVFVMLLCIMKVHSSSDSIHVRIFQGIQYPEVKHEQKILITKHRHQLVGSKTV